MSELTYTLVDPLKLSDSEEMTIVQFRKPLIGDIRKMPVGQPELDDIMKLAVNISDIPSDGIFDRLSIVDGQAIIERVVSFLGIGAQEESS